MPSTRPFRRLIARRAGVVAAGAVALAIAQAGQVPPAAAAAQHPPRKIAARAAELADAATGKQLWGRRQYSAAPDRQHHQGDDRARRGQDRRA